MSEDVLLKMRMNNMLSYYFMENEKMDISAECWDLEELKDNYAVLTLDDLETVMKKEYRNDHNLVEFENSFNKLCLACRPYSINVAELWNKHYDSEPVIEQNTPLSDELNHIKYQRVYNKCLQDIVNYKKRENK